MSAEAHQYERRRHPRRPVNRPTWMRPNEWSSLQVEVVDISPRGFRVACDAMLRVGGYVTLEVHGVGRVEAKIVWRRGREAGAEFIRPVPLEYCGWVEGSRASEDPKDNPVASLVDLLAERAARRADTTGADGSA